MLCCPCVLINYKQVPLLPTGLCKSKYPWVGVWHQKGKLCLKWKCWHVLKWIYMLTCIYCYDNIVQYLNWCQLNISKRKKIEFSSTSSNASIKSQTDIKFENILLVLKISSKHLSFFSGSICSAFQILFLENRHTKGFQFCDIWYLQGFKADSQYYMNSDIVNSPRPVISNSGAIWIKRSIMRSFSKGLQVQPTLKVFLFCLLFCLQMMKELTKWDIFDAIRPIGNILRMRHLLCFYVQPNRSLEIGKTNQIRIIKTSPWSWNFFLFVYF